MAQFTLDRTRSDRSIVLLSGAAALSQGGLPRLCFDLHTKLNRLAIATVDIVAQTRRPEANTVPYTQNAKC